MQRHDPSSSGIRASAAPLAPSALDRLVQRVQHVAPRLSQLSDRLLVAVAAVAVLVDVAVWATDPVVDDGRLPFSLAVLVPVIGVVATVAFALRTRRDALALAVVAGVSTGLTLVCWAVGTSLPPSFAALFALALLTTRVLRREQGRLAILLTVAAGVAVAAESLRPMVGTAVYLLVVCEGAFGVAVGVGVYLRWSDWRGVVLAEAARKDERLEIAREVHDLVGHHLTAIVVQAQAARHVADRRAEAAPEALERIERAGVEALTSMRRMVGGLRDGTPAAAGATWTDVERLLADAAAEGLPVSASIAVEGGEVDPALVPSVYRILAESLTNVRRHATAVTAVEVDVRSGTDRLVVRVRDDGVALGPTGQDTFGILGMRERATAMGGSLVAGPSDAGGWVVSAELPMARVG